MANTPIFKKPLRKYYTGIGTRNTDLAMQTVMTDISRYLESKNYILRSGGAEGADSAFERGVKLPEMKEIFLPWKGFNGNTSMFFPLPEAFTIASKYHPAWENLTRGAKCLHARNVHQVLGIDLMTPSEFVICYTTDGAASGGTGQAMRIATAYRVPIYNLHSFDDCQRLTNFVKTL